MRFLAVWFAFILTVPRPVSAFVVAPLRTRSSSFSSALVQVQVVSSNTNLYPLHGRPFTAAQRAQSSLNQRPQPRSPPTELTVNAAAIGEADADADEHLAPDTVTVTVTDTDTATDTDNKTDTVIQVESLTQDQIAELIEVSFIQACLSLAQGYVDTLKLFIVAVKASYERGNIAVEDLVTAVNECPTNTAGRPLMPEEVALRSTWIHAVHLMLEHIGHTTSKAGDGTDATIHQIDSEVRETYNPILDDVVKAKALGDVWHTNDFVAKHQDVLPDAILEDQVEMAVVSQTIKVLYYTLVVLAEERLANLEEDDGDDTPVAMAKPKIPRGTGFN